jgi:MoxR-like ATPase
MSENLASINQQVERMHPWISLLEKEIGRVVIGQKYLVERLLVALLANGHLLIEGVPGLAKTLSVRTLSNAIQAHFKRIQFTPDLLPADIVGTMIYHPHNGEFQTKQGPIFANIILADEINRAPAKVQSALLEAMQEHQVTIGDATYPLPEPFIVLATQNPIDQEGTYSLPEAQVDRFMMKLKIGYPSETEELAILEAMASTDPKTTVNTVATLDQILQTRTVVDKIYVADEIKRYIVSIVLATRDPERFGLNDLRPLIQYGASPRATIALALAGKAWAFLQGRGFVVPQDIKSIGMDVLRHRIICSYEAQAEGISSEDIIGKIFATVPVP